MIEALRSQTIVGLSVVVACGNLRKIGNVDEGIVERGKDTSDTEDKLA